MPKPMLAYVVVLCVAANIGCSSISATPGLATVESSATPIANHHRRMGRSLSGPESSSDFPDKFDCKGTLYKVLTDASEETWYLSSVLTSIDIEYRSNQGAPSLLFIKDGTPLQDAGLSSTTGQVIVSYQPNGTAYWTATTSPSVSKIDYSFFMFTDQNGRGALVFRSLSDGLIISYLDLKCVPIED